MENSHVYTYAVKSRESNAARPYIVSSIYIHSFIPDIFIAPLQETYSERSQSSYGQREMS